MDTVPGLRELQDRKRDLLLESEINRQVLRVELSKIRVRLDQLHRGFDWANTAWKWGAPVAALFVARKFNKTAGFFAKGSLVAGLVRTLWKAWATARERSSI